MVTREVTRRLPSIRARLVRFTGMSEPMADPTRLDAVRRSGMIGSPREPIFDELTKAAARLMSAPYALISIMDQTDSYWKSTFGLGKLAFGHGSRA